MGSFPDALPFAFPLLEIILLAVLLGLQHKALGLDHVKEEVPH